jgi:DnaK suppressor protein
MEHLTPDQLDELRAALRDEEAALRARLRASVRSSSAVDGDDDAEPSDSQDDAARELELGLGLEDRRRVDERLTKVVAALAQLDAGTYGVCEDTGDPIPYLRLRAEPTTTLTVEAAQEREREAEQRHRSGADGGAEAY